MRIFAALRTFSRERLPSVFGQPAQREAARAPPAHDSLRLAQGISVRRTHEGSTISQQVEISSDYTPGGLARLVEMHAAYYARAWGFGRFFEARVAREAAEFVMALPRADSRLWLAQAAGRVVGTIAIDGRRATTAGAHLRGFILDDFARGHGTGARLLDAALAFCRAQGFASVHLSTFAGLDDARRLYETRGFRLVEEAEAESWGARVREQSFELDLSAA